MSNSFLADLELCIIVKDRDPTGHRGSMVRDEVSVRRYILCLERCRKSKVPCVDQELKSKTISARNQDSEESSAFEG